MKITYILIIIFLSSILFGDHFIKDRNRKEVEIIANKGNSYYFPENTLSSFKNAIKLGANIKSEIRLTEDNIPVFLTDDFIDRTSNGTGFLKSKTLLELKGYDFGYKNKFGEKYKGEHILTFEEALKLSKSTKYYLELKDIEAIEPIKKIINKTGYNKSNIIFIVDKIEDNDDLLKSLKGFTLYYTFFFDDYLQLKEKEDLFYLLKKNSIKGLCINYTHFFSIEETTRNVFLVIAAKHKIPIELHTVNNSTDIQKAMDYQVKGVIRKKTYMGKISKIRTDVLEICTLLKGKKIAL